MADPPVHIKLSFNDMVMTVSDDEKQCHLSARFWLPWGDMDRVDMFLKMNGMSTVSDKKVFGTLVGSGIIRLRNMQQR